MTRLVRLAFLSPAIVEAVLAGESPARLNVVTLRVAQIPPRWDDQMAALVEARPA